MSKSGSPGKDPARWEQRYKDDEIPWDSGSPDPYLQQIIEQYGLEPGKVLEVGCGTGTNAIWLDEQGFDVLGLDVSRTAVEVAQKRAREAGAGCELRVAHFLSDPLPAGPFRLIYDRAVFHIFDEPADRAHFAARVAELLEPGGIWHSLLGSTDGPPRDTGPPRRSAADITAAVEPHFEILQLTSTAFDQGRHAQARAWVLVARVRGAGDETKGIAQRRRGAKEHRGVELIPGDG